MSAEELWLKVKENLLKIDDVQTQGKALKIKKKMFAFPGESIIIVKLPKDRVTELLNSGVGLPYDPGNGKIMKEWVIIPIDHSDKWLDFTKEAMKFALTLAK
ncbi:MAG: hypothetical protein FK733_08515 [Asgard group archaeon]|nr:hypothetical protein [Asgard group archaeon]